MQSQLPRVRVQPKRATQQQDLQMLQARLLLHLIHNTWQPVSALPTEHIPSGQWSIDMQVIGSNEP
jgi:hypothetical protein